ncbi:MAG: sugar phosphate isomerase/epimerase [Mariniblastus sp.]|nr:sugar phosphate isomerase/epimerase [Mariniblastus sp.]
MFTRRDILAAGSALAASLPLENLAGLTTQTVSPVPVILFEKVLQNLDPDQLSEALVEIDADGIEVAIRPGGRIEPADAAKKLPPLVQALERRGKKILLATTRITSVTPASTELLRVLADNQIPQYRMGYYRWKETDQWSQQRTIVQQQMQELAELNQKIGIRGLYQNHAGKRYYGALVYEILSIISKLDANQINLALDLRHLRAEAGLSWPTVLRLAAPRTGCLYIKDARWQGPRTDQLENVPLGTGFVDRAMFETARKACPSVPISLHVEYHGGKPLEGADLQQAIASYRKDTRLLRQWMAETNP